MNDEIFNNHWGQYPGEHLHKPDRSPDNNTPKAQEDKGLADETTTEF